MLGWLLLGGVAWAFARTRGPWAHGTGPFDLYPDGTERSKALSVEDVFALSKAKYRVSSFRRGAEQVYHVALRAGGGGPGVAGGNTDWIGFLVDERTKARVLYRANASTTTGMDQLRKDFAL